jgi:hypothetical protein
VAHHAVDPRCSLAAIDWVALRIASSFAELERTRSFLKVLDLAGSPFWLVRKIRSCSLRTLRSTPGQSMLDQLWRAPRPAVGSVLITV